MHYPFSRRFWMLLAGTLLGATLWIGRSDWVSVALAQQAQPTAERRSLVLDRAPARVIANPAPVLGAIAIDEGREEVFIGNNNDASPQHSVLVYPTQFTPTDRILEPRRVLGGPSVELGAICGLALSPEHKEMFTVGGESHEMKVYPLDANGDVAPIRQLSMARAFGGIFLDPKHDELYLTTEHANRLAVYHRTDEGAATPLRLIQGPQTELADPHAVFVENETNEVFVTNHGNWRKTPNGEGGPTWGYSDDSTKPETPEPLGPSTGKFLPPSITVYPRTATGDVPPLRVIQGRRTGLNLPLGVHRDPVSGQIAVANSGDHSVVFFDGKASGDVAPVRILKGPATKLRAPTGVWIDPKHNELWVTSWESHIASVFPRTAEGNAAPLRVIRSASDNTPINTLGRPSAMTYDRKRKELLVSN